jgi:hypothetical protein
MLADCRGERKERSVDRMILRSVESWAARRDRILALAEALNAATGEVLLAEVDGEFYWRLCRDDLLGPLTALAASLAPCVLGRDDPPDFDVAEQERIAAFAAFMRGRSVPDRSAAEREDRIRREVLLFERQLQIWRLAQSGRQFVDQLPPFVWSRFAVNRRIPLRAPLWYDVADHGRTVLLQVASRAVTGDDLEAEVASLRGSYVYADDPFDEDWDEEAVLAILAAETDPCQHPPVTLSAQFALVTAPNVEMPFVGLHPWGDGPFVAVRLRRPLPPAGCIGPFYDAVVRRQCRWHGQLPGDAPTQERWVAIRTWASALLIAGGERYLDAQRSVEGRTGIPAVSQSCFNADRARLLARVPEATPFLYTRGDRASSLAKH